MMFPKKVAIITEYMSDLGGSDRVISSLLEIFPDADIYTSVFNKKKYSELKNKVYSSKLNNFFSKVLFRNFSVISPLIFENFDLRGYELVISVSAGASKGVITYLDQPHVCIMCTPPRHQWENLVNVRGSLLRSIYRLGSKLVSHYIRIWDITAVERIDYIVSISKHIQKKVRKIYKRDSELIYPGIEERFFNSIRKEELDKIREKYSLPEKYMYVVTRLFDYKNVDWAIKAAIACNKDLVVVGTGPDMRYLKNISKGCKNIYLLGYLNDYEVQVLYNGAEVFLFPALEDFGLVPVEAMATGLPVLGRRNGGILESVVEGRTGFFFDSYTDLVSLIKKEAWRSLDRKLIVNRAKIFTKKKFIRSFKEYLKRIYEKKK